LPSSKESKEILAEDSGNIQSSGTANSFNDDEVVEVTKIETVEELDDLHGTSESSSESDAIINNVDDDEELAESEKSKHEVSEMNVTI
jgi:hypothetical protein